MRKIILRLLAVFGVLAILFFLTTTLSTPDKIGLTGTAEPKDPSNYKDLIELVLAGNERIYAYKGNMDSAKLLSLSPDNTLRSYLAAIKSSITDNVLVVIRASDKTEPKTTIDVLDEMVINGIRNYALQDITPAQEKKFLQGNNASKSSNDDTAMK
jgi:biopolymer transport protein ExbD